MPRFVRLKPDPARDRARRAEVVAEVERDAVERVVAAGAGRLGEQRRRAGQVSGASRSAPDAVGHPRVERLGAGSKSSSSA